MGIFDSLFKPNIAKLKEKHDFDGLIKAAKHKDLSIQNNAVLALVDIILKEKKLEIKKSASAALVKIGISAIEPLLPMLSSNDEDRVIAVDILQGIGYQPTSQAEQIVYLFATKRWYDLVKIGKPALGILINALKDKNFEIRQSAAKALGEIGDADAVMPLIGLLKDTYYGVREAAMDALVKIGEPVVEVLATILKGENFSEREMAIKILGNIKNEEAIKQLIKLLDDRNSRIRTAAWETLVKLEWQPKNDDEKISSLIASELVSKGKFSELTKFGSKAVSRLIDLLKNDDLGVRQAAAEVLGELGDMKAVTHLIDTIYDDNPAIRGAAIDAIINIGDIESLVPLLSTSNVELRHLIINALLTLGYRPSKLEEQIEFFIVAKRWDDIVKIGKPAVRTLITALNDSAQDVRIAAAKALGEIKDEEAIKALIEVLEDNNVGVQNAAVSSLVNIGEPSIKPLITNLNNDNPYVREKIIEALGQMNNSKAKESLIIGLQDEYPIVRMAAVKALIKLQDSKIIPLLIKVALENNDVNVRKLAIEVLGNAKEAESLIGILKDENSSIRMVTVNALAKLNDYKIVEPLIAVALEDKDSNVRRVATDSVINLKPMVEALMESDNSISESAAVSLRKIDAMIKAEEQKRAEAERRDAEEKRKKEEEKRKAEELRKIEERRKEEEERRKKILDEEIKAGICQICHQREAMEIAGRKVALHIDDDFKLICEHCATCRKCGDKRASQVCYRCGARFCVRCYPERIVGSSRPRPCPLCGYW